MKKVEDPCDDLIESARYNTLLLSVQQFKKGLDKIRKQGVAKYVKKVSGNEKESMESFATWVGKLAEESHPFLIGKVLLSKAPEDSILNFMIQKKTGLSMLGKY